MAGEGPPVHGDWGRKQLFLTSAALEWACNRAFRKRRPVQAAAAPATNGTEIKEQMPPEPQAFSTAQAEPSPRPAPVVDDDDHLPPF